jgi:hypothetical protein
LARAFFANALIWVNAPLTPEMKRMASQCSFSFPGNDNKAEIPVREGDLNPPTAPVSCFMCSKAGVSVSAQFGCATLCAPFPVVNVVLDVQKVVGLAAPVEVHVRLGISAVVRMVLGVMVVSTDHDEVPFVVAAVEDAARGEYPGAMDKGGRSAGFKSGSTIQVEMDRRSRVPRWEEDGVLNVLDSC